MERQLELPFEEARKVYVEQIRRIQKVCGCSICSSPEMSSSAAEPRRPSDGYCLTALVETTIALGLTLSRITVTAKIYPTHHGIQAFYANVAAKRRAARNFDDSDTRHLATVYGDEWNAPDTRRLQDCAAIFSGSRPTSDIPETLVALSHEGMCVYLAKLEKPDGPARRDISGGLIRVVSGGICVRQKVFRRASLGPVGEADEWDNVWEEVPCAHLSQSLYCK